MVVPSRRFRPRFAPTLVTTLLLCLLVSLGFWQLDRAEQKKELLSQYQRNAADAAVAIDGNLRAVGDFRYRRAVAFGRFLADRQVLLDNQFNGSQVGYHVFTAMKLDGTETLLLVNRGWIPMGSNRAVIPDIEVVDTPVRVLGLLNTPPEVGMRLGSLNQSSGEWPLVTPYMDTEFLAETFGEPVLPYILMLDPENAHGYVREWQIVSFPPEKNLGYAFQWFTMAAALVILYLYVSLRRSETDSSQ